MDQQVPPDQPERQLRVIAQIVAAASGAGITVWLRGGWAMDFFLGRVTRPHVDVDWFCRDVDAEVLTAVLHGLGYRDDPASPPPDLQRDLVSPDGTEVSLTLLGRDGAGQPVVPAGPYAGERWQVDLLAGDPAVLSGVTCPIVSPRAQIEIKEMMPVWVPGLARRPKDRDDIARLRAALKTGPAHIANPADRL
jgi:Aminoglycoside-2''-adenylyltransferase